jgi:hypothetical protein
MHFVVSSFQILLDASRVDLIRKKCVAERGVYLRVWDKRGHTVATMGAGGSKSKEEREEEKRKKAEEKAAKKAAKEEAKRNKGKKSGTAARRDDSARGRR